MGKPIEKQVIVITGASSGIGLRTAIEAARRGARLLLAGDGENVARAAEGISMGGGVALAVPADVTSVDELEKVAARAMDEFEGIDSWINCASAAVKRSFRNQSISEVRQAFERDFIGHVSCAQVALPYLESSGGTFVCVGAIDLEGAGRLPAVAEAANRALEGWLDEVRAELEEDGADVRVSSILARAEEERLDAETLLESIFQACEGDGEEIRLTGAEAQADTERESAEDHEAPEVIEEAGLDLGNQAESDVADMMLFADEAARLREELDFGRRKKLLSRTWVRASLAGLGFAVAGAAAFMAYRKFSQTREVGDEEEATMAPANPLPEFSIPPRPEREVAV